MNELPGVRGGNAARLGVDLAQVVEIAGGHRVDRVQRPLHDVGDPGYLTAPAYLTALDRVRAAALQHGPACGLLVAVGGAAAVFLRKGVEHRVTRGFGLSPKRKGR